MRKIREDIGSTAVPALRPHSLKPNLLIPRNGGGKEFILLYRTQFGKNYL